MSFSPNPLASVFPWDDADSMQDYAGMIALYSKRIAVISVCYFVVVDTRIVLFSLQYRFYIQYANIDVLFTSESNFV